MATNANKSKAARTPASDNASTVTATEQEPTTVVTVEAGIQDSATANGDTSTDVTQKDNDKKESNEESKKEEEESDKPVSAPPARLVDQRVLSIAAMVAFEFPEGASIEDLSGKLGYDERALTQLLNAMVHYKAAVKLEGDTERWALGAAKPSTVDLGELPACAHCGEYPSIMRNGNGSAPVKRASSNGQSTPGENKNGDRKLAPGELSTMVENYIDARPGQKHVASVIAADLSKEHNRNVGTSSVTYAIDALMDKKKWANDPRK